MWIMQGFAVAFVLHRESQICCTNNKKGLNQQQKNRPPLIVSQTKKSIPSVKSVIDGYNILQSRFALKLMNGTQLVHAMVWRLSFIWSPISQINFHATFVTVIDFIVLLSLLITTILTIMILITMLPVPGTTGASCWPSCWSSWSS